MTREEAIIVLNMVEAHGLADKAKRMAIKALEFDIDKHDEEVIKNTVETLWGEPCEDCISREAAIKVFGDVHPMDYNTQAYITNIQNLPSVTPKSTRGRGNWSRKTKVDAYDIAGVKTWGIKCQCDKCDFTTIVVEDFGYYKYCPNCGCRMIESEEV